MIGTIAVSCLRLACASWFQTFFNACLHKTNNLIENFSRMCTRRKFSVLLKNKGENEHRVELLRGHLVWEMSDPLSFFTLFFRYILWSGINHHYILSKLITTYDKTGHFTKIMACTYAWQIRSIYQNYGLQLCMTRHLM